MKKLETVVKSKQYQNTIEKYFNDIGFEIINNENQKDQFKKDFTSFEMDLKDKENFLIYSIIINTYWFCKSEDSEFFGLYFNPKINEYTCIIQLDNEWCIRYMGNDVKTWINKFFRRKKGRNIGEKVTLFQNEIFDLNEEIETYPDITDSDLFLFYDV